MIFRVLKSYRFLSMTDNLFVCVKTVSSKLVKVLYPIKIHILNLGLNMFLSGLFLFIKSMHIVTSACLT